MSGETVLAVALRLVSNGFSVAHYSHHQGREAEHLLPSSIKSETAAQTYQLTIIFVG